MKALLNKNKLWLGVVLGAIIPVLSYILFYALAMLTTDDSGQMLVEKSTIQVVSIVANVFLFRYYMINKKHDETGKGMLLSTFIYAFVYMFLYL